MWTREQQAAIDIRGANLLVSAAAGSGKTAVLVERITTLLRNREADVEELLVVTYTNAAAGEMRARIERALILAGESEAYFHGQIRKLSRAHIKTFHAFCLDVVRSHFQEIDCDPGFKIIGDAERSVLIEQALDDVLEQFYAEADPAFLELVEGYSGRRDDAKLREKIVSLFEFMYSQVSPSQWLEKHALTYRIGDGTKWEAVLMAQFRMLLEGAVAELEVGLALCDAPGGPTPYRATLEGDILDLTALLEHCDTLDELESAVSNFQFRRIATIKKADRAQYDEASIAQVKEHIRDKRVKKLAFAPIKDFFKYKSMTRYRKELPGIFPAIKVLCDLTEAFLNTYMALKAEKNFMDFGDLEHYTVAILENPDICAALQAQFAYIFVDEYQDASALQEHIVSKISRGHNVFMVGDVKQSIYKFRLADPEIFLEKYRTYTPLDTFLAQSPDMTLDQLNAHIADTAPPPNLRIDLKQNFRTRDTVLEAVNGVFERTMSERLGDIDYDAAARLYPGAAFEPARVPSVEMHVIPPFDAEEAASVSEPLDSDEALYAEAMQREDREAAVIAHWIEERIGTDIYDAKLKTYRPCTYRDIVVLMRSVHTWTPAFEAQFVSRDIPIFTESRTGYFDALEIRFAIAFLEAIDNPLRDIAILTVLRSPFVGVDVEGLLALKHAFPEEKTYYRRCMRCVEEAPKTIDARTRERVQGFLDHLRELQARARYSALDELIWSLLQVGDFYQVVGAMPGGNVRRRNLDRLIQNAEALKQSRVLTLSQFIEFMRSMKVDMGSASAIGENDDVVRLMSIHKSKGLEFPVVIVAGLGRRFNLSDAYGDMVLHKHLGIGLSAVNLDLKTRSRTLGQWAIRTQLRRETLAEEMRVLYVALTRSMDQLVLFASRSEEWGVFLDDLALYGAQSFSDWLLPALEQCGIPVDVHRDHARGIPVKASSEQLPWDDASEDSLDFEMPLLPKASARVALPSKISVTTLLSGTRTPEFRTPDFLKRDRELSAAEKGTALHAVMEHLDFTQTYTTARLLQRVDGLIEKGWIPEAARAAIRIEDILKFLDSSLGKRLQRAQEIFKETPFVLYASGRYIQGVIDLYFKDVSGLVVVDYKSGYPQEGSTHGDQLRVYARALEAIRGERVTERYVYYFEAGIAQSVSADEGGSYV